MATTVATKVVDLSFQSIAGKLEKMLQEEATLLIGVEDDARYIVAERRSITSFLTAMSIRRNLDDQLQNWVQEVREVAYDAEDSIDEFECRLRSTEYDEHGVKGFFKHFLRCIKSLKSRHGIASELKKLKVQVEEIKKRHDRYSHPTEAASSGTAASLAMADTYSDPRIIGHFVEEAQLVGINQSKDTLVKWVMDETRLELTMISLVGFGGLGKTTLAKTVYDDSIIVGGHFQYRAWIAVSQNYNIRELLKKTIRQISVPEQQIRDVYGCHDTSLNTEQLLNMMDDRQLVETIKAHLQGKRYLLVFDDVWRAEAWKSLSIALPSGKEGSRVIVTTRSEDVANSSCARNRQFIFKVSPLSTDLSWELFCRKVFDAPDYNCPQELENVGKEILQKCDGLPLAIVTIGGLLASKHDKKLEEWKDLRDHLSLEIQANDKLSEIDQILSLSYNDLPYDLKPCFLFLGTFPEDYEIRRKRLMRRWIAEGIVCGVGGFPAEKVAERCFNELMSRSLVQPSEFDESGTVKSCRVHDMMLEVIISTSRKENFVMLLNEHPPRHQKIRRLSCHGESSGLVPPDTDLSHLRSFSSFGEDVPLNDYRKQRLLRAIHLEGCQNLLRLHPKSFSKLWLLKYLSLRNTILSGLPDSIGDLQNLEFLDIRETYIEELPNAIVKLKKLAYLLGGRASLPGRYIYYSLKLPKGIGKLKKLRTFGTARVDNMQLPREIGGLVELQKLAITLRRDDRVSRLLKGINALLSKLNDSLRSLTIFHFGRDDLKEALDTVASPPLLLRKLHIYSPLYRLPAWFASLNQVVEITLDQIYLQPEDVQIFRNILTLVKLVLRFVHFRESEKALVFDEGGFTHLKFLEIGTHSVSFEEGALQSLETFKILFFDDKCSVDGIEHLHGLKEVRIHAKYEDIVELLKKIAANHSNSKRLKYFAATSIFEEQPYLLKLFEQQP